MTALAAPPTAPALPDRSLDRILLGVTGALLVMSGIWAVADEFDERLQRDIADTLYFRAFSLLHLVAFAALVLALGVVVRRRWAGPVVVGVAAVALLQAVCAQWYVAFVTPLLADVAPELVNNVSGWTAAGLGVALASTALGLLALGVAVLRAGVAGRAVGWLLVAAGVAFVVLPGAQLLVGAALLAGRRA